MSHLWKAKDDHPRVLMLLFVREKVAGKRKMEPRLVGVHSVLGAMLGTGGPGLEALAKDLGVPARRIEWVAYRPELREAVKERGGDGEGV
jgi:hypothetical protein